MVLTVIWNVLVAVPGLELERHGPGLPVRTRGRKREVHGAAYMVHRGTVSVYLINRFTYVLPGLTLNQPPHVRLHADCACTQPQ
jgi:hypothetical protein